VNQKRPTLRCAIYTRVSTEHGLEQEFNSLDNQREASEAYVKSQAHEGWRCLPAMPLHARRALINKAISYTSLAWLIFMVLMLGFGFYWSK
jgi:hypothetical protein